MFQVKQSTTPVEKISFDAKRIGKHDFNGRSKLPFKSLLVGQSFFIAEFELTEDVKLEVRNRLYDYNKRYNRVFMLVKRKVLKDGLKFVQWEIARIF